MRSARLLGRDHHRLGALAAVAEAEAAIVLSRGGAAKRYEHTEPNEDCALFARGAGGSCVAVADGHHGAAGAEAAIRFVEAELVRGWTAAASGAAPFAVDAAAWRAEALRAFGGANHAVLSDAAKRVVPPAPTTFALALARPAEGLLLWAGIGDSHVFLADPSGARDVLAAARTEERTSFLGYEALKAEALAVRCATGVAELQGLRAVVLATDGISEIGIGIEDPRAAVEQALAAAAACAPERRALEVARGVGEAALAAHRQHRSGDNVACAALWLGR